MSFENSIVRDIPQSFNASTAHNHGMEVLKHSLQDQLSSPSTWPQTWLIATLKYAALFHLRLYHEYYVAFGKLLTEVPNPSSRPSARFTSKSLKNSNNKKCSKMEAHFQCWIKMTQWRRKSKFQSTVVKSELACSTLSFRNDSLMQM